ncbi:heavy-metal-associated domain-containing protein [Candidatus Halobeggiatoa sp. HSG11]|nr:heavy-metal-associated domain-containing protein [Candidatus Halobeggiatoa sp. HSG11]
MTTKTVNIPKINCGHCTGTIEREVSELEGVNSVTANKDNKTATIDWDETTIKWEQISELLEEIGFPSVD